MFVALLEGWSLGRALVLLKVSVGNIPAGEQGRCARACLPGGRHDCVD